MIDFLNPRSKKLVFSSYISLVSVVLLFVGMLVTYAKVTEYRDAKQLAGMSALPSGDYLISEITLDTTVETTDSTDATPLETDTEPTENTEPVVAGMTFTDTDETTQQVSETTITPPKTNVVGTVTSEKVTTTQPAPTKAPEKTNQAPKAVEKIPSVNTIVIPRMGVNAVINEGSTDATLRKGVWRMPQAASPDEGGNTVITAHRYLYRPPDPRTFFLIDKMVVGDTFTVYWEGKRYDYKVRETKIIEPTEVSILHNTPNDQITLFSCTPLFTSDKRLVVIADRI